MCFGSYHPPSLLTETYDGSSWTEVGDLNSKKMSLASAGSTTAALAGGGSLPPPRSGLTEVWDGTSWAEAADLTTATDAQANRIGASSLAALSVSGDTGSYTTAVEEWTYANRAKTVTVS